MAYDFNGTSQGLETTTTITGLSSNDGAFTIACWAYPDGTTGVGNLYASGVTGSANYTVQLRQNGTAWEAYYRSAAADNGAVYAAGLSSGAWVHVACAYGGSDIRLVTSGVERANAGAAARVNHGTIHSIGYDKNDGPTQYFDGRIAEVGIWSAKLSTGDIAQLAAGYSPLVVRRDALEAYVPMIRGTMDRALGLAWNNTASSAVIAHPRIIYSIPQEARRFTRTASGVVIPVLDEGMLVGGLCEMSGGLA